MFYISVSVIFINVLSVVFCDYFETYDFLYPCKDSVDIFLEYANSINIAGAGSYMIHVDLSQYEDEREKKLEFVFYGKATFELVDNENAALKETSSLYTVSAEISNISNIDSNITMLVSWENEIPDLISIKFNGLSICSPDLDAWTFKREQVEPEPAVTEPPQCGRKKNGGVAQLLTNAEPTAPGDWPWHAAIFKLDSRGFGQKYRCGGTLVSELTVVTAAHCITSDNGELLNPDSIVVFLGMHKLSGNTIPPQEREVFKLIKHPQFSPRPQLLNDIGIIRFTVEVEYNTFIQPACLWDADHADKSEILEHYGTLVGWGVNENNVLSTTLQKAQLPVISDITCIKKFPDFYSKYVTDYTFCAGNTNGTSPCNGDSGGGLMFPKVFQKVQVWFLRGIVSLSRTKRNSNICDTSYYVVFTDAAKYLNWIRRYI